MEIQSKFGHLSPSDADPEPSQPKAGRPKSQEKRKSILLAASELFLRHGFTSTSMDMLATQAGVSKQTVYSHFSNKDALFSAVIALKCAEYQLDDEHMLDPSKSPRDLLLQMGNQFVNLLQDKSVIAMHRVVIGEADSNPHVAELFYQATQHGYDLMRQYLQFCPTLQLDEEQTSYWSITFFNMLRGDFHMRSLLGLEHRQTVAQQQKNVATTVDFMLDVLSKRD